MPKQKLVHIYGDGEPIGRVIRTDLGVVADPTLTLQALSQNARVASALGEKWISSVNRAFKAAQAFKSVNPTDGVDFGTVIMALAKFAPADAIITNDAGNITTWAHRHWLMTPKNTLLGGVVGAMGLGVPAAIAASLAAPERIAICLVGDGGVMMTGNELATAMAYGAVPKIVIANNGIYGTIRSHQEKNFPSRISGTMLVNPDFTAWAKSFGAEAFEIALGDDVEAIVSAFLKAPGAAVLHVKSSRIALSANGTLPTS
jgi:acetolactate synthase-1/2/3 large subunit